MSQTRRLGLYLGVCAVIACGNACAVVGQGRGLERPSSVLDTDARRSYDLGVEAAQRGAWKEAAELFHLAYVRDERSTAALVNQAVALERGGAWSEAGEVYRVLLREPSEKIRGALGLARVEVALGRLNRAEEVLQEALNQAEATPELLRGMASVLLRQRRFSGAEAMARRAVLAAPESVATLETLALVYAEQGKLPLAESLLRRALGLGAEDASVHINLALFADRQGDHQRALRELGEALRVDPESAVAHANMAAIALRSRDYRRAEQSYRRALALGLTGCSTASGLGYALEGLGAGREALAELGRALTLCCEGADLLLTMGQICMGQLSDNRCALEYFERFVASQPGLSTDHHVFGLIDALRSVLGQGAQPHTGGPKRPSSGKGELDSAAADDAIVGALPGARRSKTG